MLPVDRRGSRRVSEPAEPPESQVGVFRLRAGRAARDNQDGGKVGKVMDKSMKVRRGKTFIEARWFDEEGWELGKDEITVTAYHEPRRGGGLRVLRQWANSRRSCVYVVVNAADRAKFAQALRDMADLIEGKQ